MKPISAGRCSYPRLVDATFFSFVFRPRTSQPNIPSVPVALTLLASKSTTYLGIPMLKWGPPSRSTDATHVSSSKQAKRAGKFDGGWARQPSTNSRTAAVKKLVRGIVQNQCHLRRPLLLLSFFSACSCPLQLSVQSQSSVRILTLDQISKSTLRTALRVIHWATCHSPTLALFFDPLPAPRL